jgi:hypothetical protein
MSLSQIAFAFGDWGGLADLAAKDCVLVAKHQQLRVLEHLAPGQHCQAAEETANEQVDARNDHSAMIPARKAVQA